MNAAAETLYCEPAESARPGRWLIVVVTFVMVMVAPTITIFGGPISPPTGPRAEALPLGVAAFVLQLRHGFAVADGRRPRGAWFAFVALALIAYVPLFWFGWNCSALQICVLASVPLVLRGRRAAIAIAAPIVVTDFAALMSSGTADPLANSFTIFHWTMVTLGGAAGLYGSARLVRLVDELRGTRTDLAAVAIGRERLRVSRDLHDLLGQSLSAIALKGDLAIRLLPRDAAAAGVEVESVASLARDALRGIRAISRDEHGLSLRTESEGAIALLSAAGVEAHVALDLPDLDPAHERVLAWGLREGVANTLRHSQAHVCSITAGRHEHSVFLEIVNDGAPDSSGEGTGLAGLTERARVLSGSVAAVHLLGGRFRLRIELPEGSA